MATSKNTEHNCTAVLLVFLIATCAILPSIIWYIAQPLGDTSFTALFRIGIAINIVMAGTYLALRKSPLFWYTSSCIIGLLVMEFVLGGIHVRYRLTPEQLEQEFVDWRNGFWAFSVTFVAGVVHAICKTGDAKVVQEDPMNNVDSKD